MIQKTDNFSRLAGRQLTFSLEPISGVYDFGDYVEDHTSQETFARHAEMKLTYSANLLHAQYINYQDVS